VKFISKPMIHFWRGAAHGVWESRGQVSKTKKKV